MWSKLQEYARYLGLDAASTEAKYCLLGVILVKFGTGAIGIWGIINIYFFSFYKKVNQSTLQYSIPWGSSISKEFQRHFLIMLAAPFEILELLFYLLSASLILHFSELFFCFFSLKLQYNSDLEMSEFSFLITAAAIPMSVIAIFSI